MVLSKASIISGLLMSLLLVGEAFQFTKSSELGPAHLFFAFVGAAYTYRYKITARQFLLSLTLILYVPIAGFNSGLFLSLLKSVSIVGLLVLIYLSAAWRIFEDIDVKRILEISLYFIFFGFFSFLVFDLFSFDFRYKFTFSEPFNLATYVITALTIIRFFGPVNPIMLLMSVLVVFATKSVVGAVFMALFLVWWSRKYFLYISLGAITAVISGIEVLSIDSRVIQNVLDLIVVIQGADISYVGNPSTFALISNLWIAFQCLGDYPLGVGVGNYSFAYWTYIAELPVYEEAIDANYIGINAAGGAGTFMRLLVEFGIVGLFFVGLAIALCLRTDYKFETLLLLCMYLLRTENYFKPEFILLVWFILWRYVVNEKAFGDRFRGIHWP